MDRRIEVPCSVCLGLEEVRCKTCNGTGDFGYGACRECNGRGWKLCAHCDGAGVEIRVVKDKRTGLAPTFHPSELLWRIADHDSRLLLQKMRDDIARGKLEPLAGPFDRE